MEVRYIVSALAVMLASVSCVDKFAEIRQMPGSKECVKISLSYSCEGMSTKSVQVEDILISDLCLFVYDADSVLTASEYCEGTLPESISLQITEGACKLMCLANCGDLTSSPLFNTISGCRNYKYRINSPDGICDSKGAVPMSFESSWFVPGEVDCVHIILRRCIARIQLHLENGSLGKGGNFRASAIRIHNLPSSVTPFSLKSKVSAEEMLEACDSSSVLELENFNDGGSVSFNMLENMQGQLLEGNTLQSDKYFSEGDSRSELCTYIEVEGTVTTDGLSGKMAYRFYPGKDAISDFSIERNLVYDIAITPTAEGIGEMTWRVETREIKYLITSITINCQNTTLYTRGSPSSTSITIHTRPSQAEKLYSLEVSDTSVIKLEGNSIFALKPGQATVTARTLDGSGLTASKMITVKNPSINSIKFPYSKLHIQESEDVCMNIYWSNGGWSAEKVKQGVSYTVDPDFIVVQNGRMTPIKEGKTTIGYTIDNGDEVRSGSADVTIYGIDHLGTSPSSIVLATNLDEYKSGTLNPALYWKDSYIKVVEGSLECSSSSGYSYIDINGSNISLIKSGTVTIPLKVTSGEYTGTSTVIITPAHLDIWVRETTVKVGGTINPSIWIVGSNDESIATPANVDLEYSFSNKSVASVDFTGTITAKAAGTTTVTVSYKRKISASITLTVTN